MASGSFPSGSAGSVLEKFVDKRLVGLGLFGGEAAKLRQKARGHADRYQFLGVSASGSAHAASALQFKVG
jgi:hypothetical protein